MSDLYCLKCKKYAYHNHKCDIMSLVPVTRRCKTLADKLYSMGIEPLSVGHFTQKVNGSENKYIINVCIELRHRYQIDILGGLPIKWRLYTETCSSDRTQLVIPILAYYETYYCDDVKAVDNRVKEVIDGFVQYLDDNYDAAATKAVISLTYS